MCGKPLSDDGKDNTVQRHKEHIIHNSLYGRLKSTSILCEKCGNAYSKEDGNFVSLFSGFLETLHDYLYRKDHGKDKPKRLKAYFYPNSEKESDNKEDVEYCAGKVYPLKPYYEVSEENKEIRIVAHKGRLPHFEKFLLKEHPEYAEYKRILLDDISDLGKIGIFFSENNSDFNMIFKKGMIKIATEYALSQGIERRDLTDTLIVHDDNSATVMFDCAILVPCTPHAGIGLAVDFVEDIINPNYPSHVLRLFSDVNKYGRFLTCYIDLFSTFRYYVILNHNYTGSDIDVHYSQRLMMGYDEKGECINPSYDLEQANKIFCDNMYRMLSDYINKQILPELCIDKCSWEHLISGLIEEEGVEQVVRELVDFFNISNYGKYVTFHYDDEAPSVVSKCQMSVDTFKSNNDNIRTCTMFKFQQLNRFCWNVDKFMSQYAKTDKESF